MEFKEIIKEWQEEFPILSRYTPSTMFAKSDIVLIGLRLYRRFSDEYDVILEILPLWVPKKNIFIPLFHDQIHDEKGLGLILENRFHDQLLSDYVEFQKARGVVEIDLKKFELEKKSAYG